MNARVITGIIGVPLLLVCCYFGGWLIAVLAALLAVIGSLEAGRLFKSRGWQPCLPLDVAAALLISLSLGLSPRQGGWPFAVAVLLTALGYAILSERQNRPLSHSLVMAAVTLYIGVGFGSLLALRWGAINWLLILLAFINVWATDTAAYEVGRRYGKTKLAPIISPHKTWEGALAGLASACIISSVYMSLTMLEVNFARAMELALLFSLLAQVGDLAESAFKRWAGVKDSGSLLPGHGGVLDRFDSLLLSAPFILLLVSMP